jgi:hypothetical protein
MSLAGTSFREAQARLNAVEVATFRMCAVQRRDLVAVARVDRRGCLTRSAAEREVGAPCARACSYLSKTCQTSLAPLWSYKIFLRVQASTRRGRANRLA